MIKDMEEELTSLINNFQNKDYGNKTKELGGFNKVKYDPSYTYIDQKVVSLMVT